MLRYFFHLFDGGEDLDLRLLIKYKKKKETRVTCRRHVWSITIDHTMFFPYRTGRFKVQEQNFQYTY